MLKEDIVNTLRIITMNDPNAIVEIRLLPRSKKGYIVSGYFDSKAFPAAASRLEQILNNDSHNAYVTLNKLHDGLLARYYRRFEQSPVRVTMDKEIEFYRWILMDFDPVRPAGINATDEEVRSAIDLAAIVKEFCIGTMHMDEPVECLSGNGVHLLFPFDLPANEQNISAVKNLLNDLARKFNTDQCKLDTANYNPARITKLYGTISSKGDNTPDRPSRKSEILRIPEGLAIS